MSKTAIIIGSTGLTGSHLLQILLDSKEYNSVISFVRKPSNIKHTKLIEHVIDFDKPDSYRYLVKGDDFFCCLGTTIKKAGSQEAFRRVDYVYPTRFAEIAAKNGVKQFLIITAIGSNAQSKTFYIRTKGECEESLENYDFKTVAIFRPSILEGNRQEFRLGEKAGIYLMKIFSFFLFGKMRKYRSIDSKKVAFAMYAVAQQNKEGYLIYESDEISDIFARWNI